MKLKKKEFLKITSKKSLFNLKVNLFLEQKRRMYVSRQVMTQLQNCGSKKRNSKELTKSPLIPFVILLLLVLLILCSLRKGPFGYYRHYMYTARQKKRHVCYVFGVLRKSFHRIM